MIANATPLTLPPAPPDRVAPARSPDRHPSRETNGRATGEPLRRWPDSLRRGRGLLLLVLITTTGLASRGQPGPAPETVAVLGQPLVFANPQGYCTPGASARERQLLAVARRALGAGNRLVHAAIRCPELEDFRRGRRENIDHWLQIQLIGSKGKFQRLEMSREAFLSGMATTSPRVNSAELNRRLQASLAHGTVSLSQMHVEPIGRDGNAVYFALRMQLNTAEDARLVTGISAITLLNALALSINVYEGTGSAASRGQLQGVQHALLNSLLTEN